MEGFKPQPEQIKERMQREGIPAEQAYRQAQKQNILEEVEKLNDIRDVRMFLHKLMEVLA